ncbi:protein of unknown function [Pseudomonas mediterranea]
MRSRPFIPRLCQRVLRLGGLARAYEGADGANASQLSHNPVGAKLARDCGKSVSSNVD